jgi:hypothetical protein
VSDEVLAQRIQEYSLIDPEAGDPDLDVTGGSTLHAPLFPGVFPASGSPAAASAAVLLSVSPADVAAASFLAFQTSPSTSPGSQPAGRLLVGDSRRRCGLVR